MADEGFKRKFTAILSADVDGYNQLMGEGGGLTIRTLTVCLTSLSFKLLNPQMEGTKWNAQYVSLKIKRR